VGQAVHPQAEVLVAQVVRVAQAVHPQAEVLVVRVAQAVHP